MFTDLSRHELDMVFQFQHVQVDFTNDRFVPHPLRLPDLKEAMATWQTGLAERGWNSLYFGNHDQPRSLSRFGDDGVHRVASAKALATVLHLHRGTPYVYQGDELGQANVAFPAITDYRDIQTLNYYTQVAARGDADLDALVKFMGRTSRDQGRTPVQWDASPAPASPPAPPGSASTPTTPRSTRRPRSASPVRSSSTTASSSSCGTADPVVTDGDFELLLPEHPAIWAFLRSTPDAQLLVAANFSSEVVTQHLDLDGDWSDASVVLTSLPADPPAALPDLKLRPWEAVIWRR